MQRQIARLTIYVPRYFWYADTIHTGGDSMEKELVILNIETMMKLLDDDHIRAIYMSVKELYKRKTYNNDSTKICQKQ